MPISLQIEKLPPAAQEALWDKEGRALDELAAIALEDDAVLDTLVTCITQKNEILRYNAVRTLEHLATQRPGRLYPAWETLAALLESPNGFHRASAVALLAAVLPADTGRRFDTLFERYIGLMDDPKVMVARYLVQSISKVAPARPDLIHQVTAHLMGLDSTHHSSSGKDLLRGDILEAFEQYLPQTPDTSREAVLAFARAALDCSSPRTRKIAKKYLLTHSG